MTKPTSLSIGGIPLTVYGLSSTPPSPHGTAVLFLLHGRFGSAAQPRLVAFANSLVAHAKNSQERSAGKDLLVVTFDQRNHGERGVDPERNKGWRDKEVSEQIENESHAVHMYSIQSESKNGLSGCLVEDGALTASRAAGTARDVSFLIDFLPATLFPSDERAIDSWFASGISLGGHSTWLALAHGPPSPPSSLSPALLTLDRFGVDPRITLGIPIIGSPSILTLLSHRAINLPPPLGPLPIAAPYFPSSLLSLIERNDPVNVPLDAWKGKKILVLSGGDDTLVNFDVGGTKSWVETLKGAGVDVSAVVEAGMWVPHSLRSCRGGLRLVLLGSRES